MTDNLVERLRNWEKVYPEDEDKPEGSLHHEAADRIEELEAELKDTTDDSCTSCKHSFERWVGMYEYDGEFIDRTVLECRRYPPVLGFLGSSFPKAVAVCGEWSEKEMEV